MLREFSKHKLSYSILVVVLLLGVLAFLAAWPDRASQRLISVAIAMFYILWGIIFHVNIKQISRKVVLEYLGVGILAGVLLVLVTL